MKNQYYTPAIEDLRVGYECEVNWALAYQDKWDKTVIGYKEAFGAYTNELTEIIHAMDDGYAEVRTLYLTKEQIEAEGWSSYDTIDMRGSYEPYWEVQMRKGLWELFFRSDIHRLQITGKAGSITRYHGKCPSINEFRKIQQWLGIK